MAQASSFEHRRPQRPGGMGRGAMMALFVHAGLLIALAFGVSWRSREPAGSSAELWAAVPQVAAPAAVEPPPPPLPKPLPKVEVKPVEAPPPPKPDTRDADIAIEKAKAAEKEKREEQEREKQERLKAEKLEREKAAKLERDKAEKEKREDAERQRREEEQLAKQRDENLRRIAGQAGATGTPQSTGTATRSAGASSGWGGKIKARVQPNIVWTESAPPGLLASVELRVAPDGTITARRLVKSSGNSGWDDAVLRAIDRTETLPKDDDGRVQPVVVIDFKP
jgi:colicin import membrane protein